MPILRGRLIGFWIEGFGLKNRTARDFCGKSSGLADRRSAVILTRILDCACLMLGSWVLNEIWIIGFSSALVSM